MDQASRAQVPRSSCDRVAVGVVAADHRRSRRARGGLGVDQVLVVGAGDVGPEDHVGRSG
jgi:hypothetical protein